MDRRGQQRLVSIEIQPPDPNTFLMNRIQQYWYHKRCVFIFWLVLICLIIIAIITSVVVFIVAPSIPRGQGFSQQYFQFNNQIWRPEKPTKEEIKEEENDGYFNKMDKNQDQATMKQETSQNEIIFDPNTEPIILSPTQMLQYQNVGSLSGKSTHYAARTFHDRYV